MIKYHGMPITPATAAVSALSGAHGFVSFANPEQLAIAMECCESFAVDNGAFPAWKSGQPITDWHDYYAWVSSIQNHPSFDFGIIPDTIDGSEKENKRLLKDWKFGAIGAPVWHLNESLEWLEYLVKEWPRIALGSSGDFSSIGTTIWWQRMDEAMRVICDSDGVPKTKIHGLRMMDPEIFTRFPFSSADSTNIARNIGIDSTWRGNYMPFGKDARAKAIRQRIESHQSPGTYSFAKHRQTDLF